jgi:hypothetical protein
MKGKVIVISIIAIMIIGSFGAVGTSLVNEENTVETKEPDLNIAETVARQALNVGVNKNLNFCDDDARALNRFLINNGWPEDNCEIRNDDVEGGDVTVSGIKSKLQSMATKTNDNTISLFSFSGHGGRSGDASYLCCQGGNLHAADLNAILDDFKGYVVCIFDACHCGGMRPDDALFDPSEYVSDFLEDAGANNEGNQNKDRVLLMACSISQTTVEIPDYNYTEEGKGAGLWTYFVWDGLNGKADNPDSENSQGDGDGTVTAEESFKYAKNKVAKWCSDHGRTITPQLHDQDSSKDVPISGSLPNEGSVKVTLNMRRILEVDDIEPVIPYLSCEWYYTVRMKSGDSAYVSTKHCPKDGLGQGKDDWTFNHAHVIETNENEVEIEIKVMEEDIDILLWGDDMADISSRSGPGEGKLDNIEESQWFGGEFENAIYHGTYTISTGELTGDAYNRNGDRYVIRGDLEPDGSTDKDTNDAQVEFTLTNDYNPVKAEGSADGPVLQNAPLPFTGSAEDGVPPYEFHWDFGDGKTSNEQNPEHAYTSAGSKNVKLTVTDMLGISSTDEFSVTVKSKDNNNKPNTPEITGTEEGSGGTSYKYTFKIDDPDEDLHDRLELYIEWGDGSNSGWLDPANPGSKEKSHTYPDFDGGLPDRYTMKARTRDCNGEISNWGRLDVTMPRTIQNLHPFLAFLLEKLNILKEKILPLLSNI